MNPYATHLPTLEPFMAMFKPKSVFEFGTGLYSTPLFVKHADRVISIEMQAADWYHTVARELGHFTNLELVLALGPDLACSLLRGSETSFDLIFVDGHGNSRWRQLNEAMLRTRTVVAHDTECSCYGWEMVTLPPQWKGVEIRGEAPWTTVITCDDTVYTWALTLPNAEPFATFQQKHYTRVG